MVASVAGCGGDDDGGPEGFETGAGRSLGKAEFIERANAVCRRARSGLGEETAIFLEQRLGKGPRWDVYADLAHLVLLPAVEREAEAIRFLGVPPSEEEVVDDMLYADQLVIDMLAHEDRIYSEQEVYREFTEAGRMFREYGLTACANGPGPAGGRS